MLISHRHEFIYTKTVKTAGTSVEVFFERFCMPEGEWEFSHLRHQHVSPAGIIGARGATAAQSLWSNHLSAREIRDQIGETIWNDYFKFTTIRDPFDKIVSYFHHEEYSFNDRTWSDLDSLEDRLEYLLWFLRVPRDAEPPASFRSWVRSERWLNRLPTYPGFGFDRDRYVIDGEECVDDFIRFESLQDEVERICDRLDLPFDDDYLPRLKSGRRPEGYDTPDYYDSETADIIANLYRWELERFGYERPTSG